jgi:energy-coupling factor transporter ATP-binding protein EcfA2
MAVNTLRVTSFAQVSEVEIAFGDLTLLIGPQATGKSLVLQLLKLAVDSSRIGGTLKKQGFHWSTRDDFCSIFFGEGMAGAWTDATTVTFNGRAVKAPPSRITHDGPRLFYIPAHRTLSVAEGWPAGFRSYRPDTPFVVRDFSEQLLELITTRRGVEGDVVFPAKKRLKRQVLDLIDEAIFHHGELKLVSDGPRRQFKLHYPGADIAYMAWTAGQREFIPLLLGVYHLVPKGRYRKVDPIEWIVVEEPEMGLHAKGVQAVMLLVLELMDRGYRVVLSTHSNTVVESVWGLLQLQAARAKPAKMLEMFGIDVARWDVTALAKSSLEKAYRVFNLDYDGDVVRSHDISGLDPESTLEWERTWGGLTRLSMQVNDAVASAVATRR